MELKKFGTVVSAQIVSALALSLNSLIDSLIVSNYLDKNAVTAYGFLHSFNLVLLAVIYILVLGIKCRCGDILKNSDTVSSTFNSVLWSTIIVAILVTVLAILRAPITRAFCLSSNPEVQLQASEYALGIMLQFLPLYLFNVMLIFSQLLDLNLCSIVVVLISIIVKTVVDIMTALNGMGLMGICLSTIIASSVSILILGIYIARTRRITISLGRKWRQSGEIMLDLFKMGSPMLYNSVGSIFSAYMLNFILSRRYDDSMIDALVIVTSVANILYCVATGVGNAYLMYSKFYPEDDRLNKLGRNYMIILNLLLCLVFLLLAGRASLMFTDDNTISSLGIRLFALSLIPSGLVTLDKYGSLGLGHTARYKFIGVFENVCIVLGACLSILVVDSIWLGYLFGELIILLVLKLWRQ